ncbi:MAG: mevalonate kinase [Sulfolobus sp.]|jgi:mevalonate kinase
MMIEAQVPLKLTLFGEHAVVYGKPAIAYTISEYLKVRVLPSERFYVRSSSLQITGVNIDLHDFKIENENVKKVLAYVVEAINYFEVKKPALIEIESSVEPSVGLGTSAAVTVGVVAAYSRYIGLDLKKEEIANIAHKVELKVQGLASIMDTTTETLGGFVYIKGDDAEILNVDRNITFSAGYFRRIATTAEMLRKVKSFKEKNSDLFNHFLHLIERITETARSYLKSGDIESLGELMYANHGALFSLGITVPVIDQLVSTARSAGVKGCKISGGGGGGSVICTKDERAELLIHAMGGRVVNATPTFEGVRIKLI